MEDVNVVLDINIADDGAEELSQESDAFNIKMEAV